MNTRVIYKSVNEMNTVRELIKDLMCFTESTTTEGHTSMFFLTKDASQPCVYIFNK